MVRVDRGNQVVQVGPYSLVDPVDQTIPCIQVHLDSQEGQGDRVALHSR